MTDVMREMIEQLMGGSRAEEEGKKLPPFDHHTVCRAYLLECCPREILTDTRLEAQVSCRKIHEPAHKADYLRAQEKRDHFYDIEAFDAIEEAIRVVDYEVEKIRQKVKKDTENMNDSQEYIKSQKVFEMNEKIGIALAQVEALGNEGKIQESMEANKMVEDLKRKKRELEAEMRIITPAQQRLRVCEVCGAQLNVLDHESRLADHYGGKMHLGMVDIREKYDSMKDKIEERRIEMRRTYEKERHERRERDRQGGSSDKRRRDDSPHRSERERKRERSRSRSPRKSSRSYRSRSPSSRSSRSTRHGDSNRDRRRSDRY